MCVRKSILINILIFLLIVIPNLLWGQTFIPVKFGVITPSYKEDNRYGDNEKYFMEAALNYSLGETSKELAACGYQFNYITNFIDNTDILSAKEAGAYIKSKDVWFVIGPNRSDLFLLTLEGLKNTPAISLMAGANAVTNKKPPVFTMYSNSKELAKAAFALVQTKKLGRNYGVFVDATCNACKDFSKDFDKIAKNQLAHRFTIDSADESPDVAPLLKLLSATPIDFLLLPNFSKLSGYVMSEVHKKFPAIKFLGTDGWGSEEHSFITDYNLPEDTVAYCVRVGMPAGKLSKFYGVYSLDREWDQVMVTPPICSYLSIELLRDIVKMLCQTKPKNKLEFYRYLKNKDSNVFKTKVGISAYKLKKSKPAFDSSLRI